MKVVELRSFGNSSDAVVLVDAPEPGPPGSDEVTFDVDAFPINPADLLMLEGRHAVTPPLPARPHGAECVGRVTAIGNAVTHIKAGDRVISLDRENWVQRKKTKARQLVPIPAGIDPLQAAMLRVNPATASLLLSNPVRLEEGDWLIQNAANSAVGRWLIALARSRGIRTVNVVRRQEAVAELTQLGADFVLVDDFHLAGDGDLPSRIASVIGSARVRLAVDAVGGFASKRVSDCLSEGGMLVSHGLLSGEPCMVDMHQLVFRGVTARGFWLRKEMPQAIEEVQALYVGLAAYLEQERIKIPIDGVYPLDRLHEALAQARRSGRSGKILILPNGPLDAST